MHQPYVSLSRTHTDAQHIVLKPLTHPLSLPHLLHLLSRHTYTHTHTTWPLCPCLLIHTHSPSLSLVPGECDRDWRWPIIWCPTESCMALHAHACTHTHIHAHSERQHLLLAVIKCCSCFNACTSLICIYNFGIWLTHSSRVTCNVRTRRECSDF